jgi:ADP-ribosylglycohydrolase
MSRIYDKLFGCIAGSWVGSAMGDPTEGWPWRKIQEIHGVLDRFIPTHKKRIGWEKPPGYTEDGIERQKLMATAIIKKQDRINARDLVETWIEVCDPEKMRWMVVPFDIELLRIAKAS